MAKQNMLICDPCESEGKLTMATERISIRRMLGGGSSLTDVCNEHLEAFDNVLPFGKSQAPKQVARPPRVTTPAGQRNKYTCPITDCARHQVGYGTETGLQWHKASDHQMYDGVAPSILRKIRERLSKNDKPTEGIDQALARTA